MVQVPNKLRSNLENKALLNQLDSHLSKFEIYGNAGLKSIEILQDIVNKDMSEFWSDNFEGIKLLRNLDGIKATIANNVCAPFLIASFIFALDIALQIQTLVILSITC